MLAFRAMDFELTPLEVDPSDCPPARRHLEKGRKTEDPQLVSYTRNVALCEMLSQDFVLFDVNTDLCGAAPRQDLKLLYVTAISV